MFPALARFWDFMVCVWRRVSEGHFSLIAAGVAFYAMFAVFPGIAATIALWSLLSDPAVVRDYLDVAEQFLPGDVANLIEAQVVSLLDARSTTLGWATVFSILVALYSARAGVAALIEGLSFVHRAEPRGLLWGWAVDILMTFALILAMFAGFVTVIAVPLVLNYVSLGPIEALVLRILPWGAMFLLVLSCLSILYRYGPNMRDGAGRPWVSVGVVVAALAWSGVSLAFSTYLANFDSYNRIYGSIGAVVALLMWLYLSVLSILLGGVINAEMTFRSRRARRDRAEA